jgi:hypothetical protein
MKDHIKNAAALLLFKGKGKGIKEEMGDDEEEDSAEYGPELMQAYLDAAEKGDAKKAYEAFKDLVDQCSED